MPDLVLHLKPREARRLRAGHPWVFANEVARVEPADGQDGTCRILDDSGRFLGAGYYNRHSLISARILTRHAGEALDESLFRNRLEEARQKRVSLYRGDESFRWVYGEADRLPGLVVDRYPTVTVVQVTTRGMDLLQPMWEPPLRELAGDRRLVYRNDTGLRLREGLPLLVAAPDGWPEPFVDFEEEGAPVVAIPCRGQKTGFFLDQRENRIWLRRLADDSSVLDLYCYTGAWGLGLLHAGAREVVFVDSSRVALAGAEQGARRGGFTPRCSFERQDVEKYLRSLQRSERRFDIVVADPPDLIPTRKALGQGRRRMLTAFTAALGVVRRGGTAALSSCSFHLQEDEFDRLIREAARRAGRDVQVIWRGGAGPDHPRPVAMPEASYLKCAFLSVE